MLTLLGSLLGFIGSMVPDVLKFFHVKGDRAHELQIMDRQMEMMKLRHGHTLDEIRTQADITEMKELYHYPRPIGIAWVDTLSCTVRPLLTYGFFLLYLGVKSIELVGLWGLLPFAEWVHALSVIWHEEDQALFAAVMSFWFGQRALKRGR